MKSLATKKEALLKKLAPFSIIITTLSVYFEHVFRDPGIMKNLSLEFIFVVSLLGLAFLGVCFKKHHRLSLSLFFLIHILTTFVISWSIFPNHGWLALWVLPAYLLFKDPLADKDYRLFVRCSLGLVMIIAGIQKIIAGTYLDGSFITFLSHYGARTEQFFGFLCEAGTEILFCPWHQVLGVLVVVTQLLVGLFLIVGWKNRYVIAFEIFFLLLVGLFADELNFQILVISLMCIAFGYRMTVRIALFCILILILDAIGLSTIINLFNPIV